MKNKRIPVIIVQISGFEHLIKTYVPVKDKLITFEYYSDEEPIKP